ncbi:MAG: alanine--glyoxylate aminotransferase family protein [bacterium]|nr:alanine--glyoxylate aminotransferase family protein [bacterium]
MKKVYLMTPGPTPVPSEVRLAEAREIIHHRTKEFSDTIKIVSEGLKPIFKTKNSVFTFAASGTGAMEGAVCNLLSKGDKALVVKGGKFGERWGNICKAYGVEAISVDIEWGDVADPAVIKKHLDDNPDIKVVFATLCETSTATEFPIKEYGEVIKSRPNTLFVVDAISGLAACDIQVDNWGVDVCVSGSQKSLMLPPGLAFASVSDKAWPFMDKSNLPKFYFDFKKARKALEKSDTPFTPGVSLIMGLKQALEMINADGGIDKVLERVTVLGDATQAAMKALGLKLISKHPAKALTGIFAPDGVDGKELKKTLEKKYGVMVAGGQDQFEGKVIRLTHLGYIGQFDILTAIAAIELSLHDLKHPVELGKGLKAAQEVFAKASI